MTTHPGLHDRDGMPDTPTHELVLRGRIGRAWLAPFLDDFTVTHTDGRTRLVGTVRDPSHLHGLVAYLASINAELISITPITRHRSST